MYNGNLVSASSLKKARRENTALKAIIATLFLTILLMTNALIRQAQHSSGESARWQRNEAEYLNKIDILQARLDEAGEAQFVANLNSEYDE